MIRRLTSFHLAGSVAIAAMLAGCQDFEAAKKQEERTQKTIEQRQMPQTALISSVDAPYLLGEPVKDQAVIPTILQAHAAMVVPRPISLRDAAIQASTITHVPVIVTSDAEDDFTNRAGEQTPTISPGNFNGQSLPAPPSLSNGAMGAAQASTHQSIDFANWHGPRRWIEYDGTRYGLFQALATRYGVWAEFRDDHEEFYRNKTRTFVVPALGGSTKTGDSIGAYSGGGGTSGSSGGMSSGSSGMSGGSGGASGSGSSGSSTGMTSVSYTSDTNRWKSLQQTAQMIAGGGHVIADEGFGTLTVSGTPEEVTRVADWMHELTETQLKQVVVDIRVYKLDATRESNYGLDWQIALKNAAQDFAISTMPAAAPVLQSSGTPFSFGAQILSSAKGATGQFSGTTAAFQALATKGDITQLYRYPIVVTNGVTAPFQNGDNTTYAASTSAVLATNAGSSTSIQPGVVMSGFAGHVTPRIIDNRIMLHLDIVLQTLQSITTFGSSNAQIQEPKTSNTSLQDQVVLKSGDTLTLVGYVNDSSSRTRNGTGSPLNWLLGGGGDAQTNKTQLMVTVEAHTL